MKKLALTLAFLIAFIPASPVFAAINADSVFELRTTGNDSYGGLYDLSLLGTDYSQSNSSALTDTDIVATNGLAAVTSASQGGFTSAMVGNGINIAGVIYEIATYVSATSITITPVYAGTTASGLTANVGGALLTPSKAFGSMVAGNTCWVKAGTYAVSSAVTGPGTTAGTWTTIEGYNTTRGDITVANGLARPIIQASTGISNMIAWAATNLVLQNIVVDANNKATTGCFSTTIQYSQIEYCLVRNYTKFAFSTASNGIVFDNCEFSSASNTVSSYAVSATGTGSVIRNCYVHDNAAPGIIIGGNGSTVSNTIVANCTGASSDGIDISGSGQYGCTVSNNDLYNNGRDGIRTSSEYPSVIQNNICVNNGGYGLDFTLTTPAQVSTDYNAFYNNTSGATHGTTGSYSFTQTLSGSPWINVSTSAGLMSTSNFELNSVSNSGALCRGTASPGTFVGISTGSIQTSLDIGAFQSGRGVGKH